MISQVFVAKLLLLVVTVVYIVQFLMVFCSIQDWGFYSPYSTKEKLFMFLHAIVFILFSA